MATRWEVEKAVLWSDLEPPARLIVLTLLTKVDNETGAISTEHTPSLSTLVGMTGLARSAVTEWLNALEDAGWVKRIRPPVGKRGRTTYVLLIGAQTVVRRTRARLVRSADQSARRTGDQSAERTVTSPPGGHASTNYPLPKPLPKPSRRERAEEPRREDVEQVCEHLADRIVANGSKRPTITDAWRTSARLLLDKDRRTVDQIIKAIDWCQDDDFWRANVLSMPKLRAKYDQLRLAAQRAPTAGRGNHQTYRNPEDASAYHGDL